MRLPPTLAAAINSRRANRLQPASRATPVGTRRALKPRRRTAWKDRQGVNQHEGDEYRIFAD